MPTATVGFVPRERFSLAPESLQTILEHTRIPFNLIVVDCNTPEVYWRRMEQLLRGRPNVTVIRRDKYLLPNQCRNLVIQEAQDEFLCLIDNDDLVGEGWLSRFLVSIDRHGVDVVIPLVMEGRPGQAKVHFDEALGRVQKVEMPDGVRWRVVRRPGRNEDDVNAAPRPEEFMETHCLFFRKSVFDRIAPFDGELSTSEEVDVSLALYHAGVPAIFDPTCVVYHIPPPTPVYPDDLEYFSMKWDIERAKRSHNRIQQRWNLIRFPQLLGFVEEKYVRGSGSLRRWREELAAAISPKDAFILVDMEQWNGSEIVEGLRNIPFLERNGAYWGPPADNETAIRELERLRGSGATAIAFTWQAFWWFDYYGEFYRYLCSRFRRALDNAHLVVFDLRN